MQLLPIVSVMSIEARGGLLLLFVIKKNKKTRCLRSAEVVNVPVPAGHRKEGRFSVEPRQFEKEKWHLEAWQWQLWMVVGGGTGRALR